MYQPLPVNQSNGAEVVLRNYQHRDHSELLLDLISRNLEEATYPICQ